MSGSQVVVPMLLGFVTGFLTAVVLYAVGSRNRGA